MSIVLDASALLAYLQGEVGADRVRAALGEAVISTVNWWAKIGLGAAPSGDHRMAQITVGNVSEEVLACLEARARANRRTLEGEVRHVLMRHARRCRIEDFRERTALLCGVAAHSGQSDSVSLLREDRAR